MDVMEQVDKLMCEAMGVSKIGISMPKINNIKVGCIYCSDAAVGIFDGIIEEIITITSIRGGIVFYTSDRGNGEYFFQLGSVKHQLLQPIEFDFKLNPKHYYVYMLYDNTKINYLYK